MLPCYYNSAIFRHHHKQQAITTINVTLPPQLDEMVRQKVASGLYTSVSEVVREALQLMEEQDRMRSTKPEQLRHDIHLGINSGEPTQWNLEEIKQEGRKRRAERSSVSQDV
ncbi:MAG: type II toxin-antitoxin system ParD family antitoxin [Methylobacter sp.]